MPVEESASHDETMTDRSDLGRTTRAGRLRAVAVVAAAFIVFGALSLRRLADHDLPWHLAFGRIVVATRTVPQVDDLSYLHEPIQYTEWIADAVLYGVHVLGGPFGLQLFGGALGVALFAALAARRDAGPLSPLAAAMVLLAAEPWLIVRPATVSFVMTALTSLLLAKHRASPTETRGRLALLAVVPLHAAWANLHQGAGLGLALVGVHAADATLTALRSPARRREAMLAIAVVFLTAGALCLNRTGPAYLWNPFKVTHLSKFVTEWEPLSLAFLVKNVPMTLGVLVIFGVAIAVGREENGKWAPLPFDVAVLFLTAALARYSRMLPYILVLLAPIAARRASFLFRRASASIAQQLPVAVAGLTLAVGTVFFFRVLPSAGPGFDPDHHPEAAVEFIKRVHPQGRMVNFFPYGGYLAWQLVSRPSSLPRWSNPDGAQHRPCLSCRDGGDRPKSVRVARCAIRICVGGLPCA